MPSLRLLRAFVAVAETGQLASGAQRLNITQPALSLQLKDLETRLGVLLVERKPGLRRIGVDKAAQLTAAGAALLPRARDILNAALELEDFAGNFSAPLAGRLRLGVIPTVAPYLLPRLLPPLARAYPAANLQVVEDKTEALVTRLRDGTLDLALLALPLGHSDLTELPLFDDPFYLVAPTAHLLLMQAKLGPQDLLAGPLLLLDDGHCLRDQALSVCQTPGARLQETGVRAASLATLVELTAHGLGVTLLPEMALERELASSSSKGGKHTLGTRAIPGAGRRIGLLHRPRHSQAEEFAKLGKLIKQAAQ